MKAWLRPVLALRVAGAFGSVRVTQAVRGPQALMKKISAVRAPLACVGMAKCALCTFTLVPRLPTRAAGDP